MSDYTIKRLDEIQLFEPAFYAAKRELGATAFGVNVLKMPAGWDGYPDHDHGEDGQEEVYVLVEGSARLRIGGEEHELTPISLVRVAAGTKRKWLPGDAGATIVAVGGVPA